MGLRLNIVLIPCRVLLAFSLWFLKILCNDLAKVLIPCRVLLAFSLRKMSGRFLRRNVLIPCRVLLAFSRAERWTGRSDYYGCFNPLQGFISVFTISYANNVTICVKVLIPCRVLLAFSRRQNDCQDCRSSVLIPCRVLLAFSPVPVPCHVSISFMF